MTPWIPQILAWPDAPPPFADSADFVDFAAASQLQFLYCGGLFNSVAGQGSAASA